MFLAFFLAAQPAPPVMMQPAPPIMLSRPPAFSVDSTSRSVMTPTRALQTGVVRLSAEEAVMKAAAADRMGVIAVFDIRTVISDEVDGRIFLGTQADYRDQRNLAIAIDPAAFRDLMRRHGAPLTDKLKGKHLLVGGFARPVRISINENGRPTGKYYYQTHVVVTHANQIEVVGE